MKDKLIVLSGVVLGLATPLVVLAQNTGLVVTNPNQLGCANISGQSTETLSQLLCKIGGILNAIIPVLIALGVVYFVWGVITYVIASDEEAKKTGRNRIIYGIIGLAVIVAVWGLVALLVRTFVPQGNSGTIQLPTVPL